MQRCRLQLVSQDAGGFGESPKRTVQMQIRSMNKSERLHGDLLSGSLARSGLLATKRHKKHKKWNPIGSLLRFLCFFVTAPLFLPFGGFDAAHLFAHGSDDVLDFPGPGTE